MQRVRSKFCFCFPQLLNKPVLATFSLKTGWFGFLRALLCFNMHKKKRFSGTKERSSCIIATSIISKNAKHQMETKSSLKKMVK